MEGWLESDNKLTKTFTFDNFLDATRWMFDVSESIEDMNHHPVWTNVYNRVEVELSTHDSGNIVTEKDFALAKLLDQAFENFR